MELDEVHEEGRGSLWIELLGEVTASLGEAKIVLGSPKQCALFTVLALRPGQVVTTSEIVDALWGEAAPATAESSIHTYVHRLRRAMQAVGAHELLVRGGAGYYLQAEADEVDLLVVESGVAEVKRLVRQGSLELAAQQLKRCLTYWQGVPLSGATGPLAEAERSRLLLRRLDLIEERAQLLLETGSHREAIGEVEEALRVEPLHEGLRGELMLALYRSGRQADALAVFDAGRRALAAELGVVPSSELTTLHARILRSDPALTSPAGEQAVVVPAQLPPTMSGFVGRTSELEQLHVWREVHAGMQALLITAVDGLGGIGKTALAVRFGRRVMREYPDGQLYVNLRGFDPTRAPLSVAEALTELLRALGSTVQPATVDAQAALYRSLLAGKRVLVMLDNAATVNQVRDLLPGACGSLVVITSRNRLGGLVAREGARRLTLGLLPAEDALEVLRQVAGTQRVAAEVDATAHLARLCGYLPLALRIAGELVSSRPGAAIAELVADLEATRDRLDTRTDDELSSIRAVFTWSYQQLKPTPTRAFRRLGLHPGAEVGVEAAATLVGMTLDHTAKVLEQLSDRHLLERLEPGRYRFHDLVRMYAGELPRSEDVKDARRSAVGG